MPYRDTTGAPCAACEAVTTDECRNCHRPVCSKHAAAYQFYVPLVECGPSLSATCERPHGEAPEERRRALTVGPLGKSKRVPNEPC
jgi:hypothetical protein